MEAYESFMIGETDPIALHSVMSAFWHLSTATGEGQSSFQASEGSVCSTLADFVSTISGQVGSSNGGRVSSSGHPPPPQPPSTPSVTWSTSTELQDDIDNAYCTTKAVWESSGIDVSEYNLVDCDA